MTNEVARIAGSIEIEEKEVFLQTVAQNRGVSSIGEVTKTEGRRINKGSKIRARQT